LIVFRIPVKFDRAGPEAHIPTVVADAGLIGSFRQLLSVLANTHSLHGASHTIPHEYVPSTVCISDDKVVRRRCEGNISSVGGHGWSVDNIFIRHVKRAIQGKNPQISGLRTLGC
jgi:hypothetical protein